MSSGFRLNRGKTLEVSLEGRTSSLRICTETENNEVFQIQISADNRKSNMLCEQETERSS